MDFSLWCFLTTVFDVFRMGNSRKSIKRCDFIFRPNWVSISVLSSQFIWRTNQYFYNFVLWKKLSCPTKQVFSRIVYLSTWTVNIIRFCFLIRFIPLKGTLWNIFISSKVWSKSNWWIWKKKSVQIARNQKWKVDWLTDRSGYGYGMFIGGMGMLKMNYWCSNSEKCWHTWTFLCLRVTQLTEITVVAWIYFAIY